jgi:hypothetical protein
MAARLVPQECVGIPGSSLVGLSPEREEHRPPVRSAGGVHGPEAVEKGLCLREPPAAKLEGRGQRVHPRMIGVRDPDPPIVERAASHFSESVSSVALRASSTKRSSGGAAVTALPARSAARTSEAAGVLHILRSWTRMHAVFYSTC